MSTVYDEGPLVNWNAISFPGQFYVSGWVDAAPLDSVGTIAPYPPGRTITTGADLQGVLRGQTSGAELDLTAVPADVGAFSAPLSAFPGCVRSYVNGYDLTGNSVTGPTARAYNLTTAGATVAAFGSWSTGATSCTFDLNGTGLGVAFQLGELVSVSK